MKQIKQNTMKEEEPAGRLYTITSPKGKIYLGQTVKTFKKRMGCHKSAAKNKEGGCRHLNNAIRKYGWENMKCELVMECSSLEIMNHFEDRFVEIWSLRNEKIGMNILKVGVRGGSTKEMHTEERTRKNKMSQPNRKSVKSFNRDTGDFIAEYNSISEAAREVNISFTHLSKVLNGTALRAKTAGGLKWAYA